MIAGSVARPFIVDTDIGSDVDDAMVLSAIGNFAEISLVGVTCVYGNVDLRAKIALKYLAGAGLGAVPVYCGESLPISGREVWHAGLEGSALGDLSEFRGRDGGVEFLVRSAREYAGELEIVAIGPLTNIARAIEADSEFARNVKRIWMMGGDYSRDFAEHNMKCDVAAAKIVFGSGVAISVMPLDVTRQVAISISDFDWLGDVDLRAEIRQWAEFKKLDINNPHDLMTLLSAVDGEIFSVSGEGRVEVSESGVTVFHGGGGNVVVVRGCDVPAVTKRVMRALQR